MDSMIEQAVRAAGRMEPHFQRRLASYLRETIQPQLDRLADLERERAQPKADRHKGRVA